MLQTVLIKNIGGRNAKDHCCRALQRLFTNQVAMQCSWKGLRNNFKVKDLQVIRLLVGKICSNCFTIHELSFIYFN